MRFGKKGQGWSWANIGAALLVLVVVIVIFFGPVGSLKAGTGDVANKSGEFGASLKALDIERLMTMDRDELTDEEKEELAENVNADATSRIENAKKFIERENYDRALLILEETRKLTGLDPETLESVDRLISEVKLRIKLAELEKRFEERVGVDDLLPLKLEVDGVVGGTSGDLKNEAMDLQKKVSDALIFENGYDVDETPRGKEYKEWLADGDKTYTETLTLARKFSEGDFDPRYVVLYNYAAEAAGNTEEEVGAKVGLADSFYDDGRFSNAVVEYENLYMFPETWTVAERLGAANKINELAKKGYASVIQWDLRLIFKLIDYDWDNARYGVVWPHDLKSFSKGEDEFADMPGGVVHHLNARTRGEIKKFEVVVPLDDASWKQDFDKAGKDVNDPDAICEEDICFLKMRLRLFDRVGNLICTPVYATGVTAEPRLVSKPEWTVACSKYSLFGTKEKGDWLYDQYQIKIKLKDYFVGSSSRPGKLYFELEAGDENEYPFNYEPYEVDLTRIS